MKFAAEEDASRSSASPFFAAGIFLTLIGLGVIVPENADELPDWSWPVFVLMGLAFGAVGGGLVFGRSWVAIDTSRGSLAKQWGLLVPMKVEEMLLHKFDAVSWQRDSGSLQPGAPSWTAWMGRFFRSKGITVKSRAGLVNFGAGLPDDEVTYLHSMIQRAVTQR